MMKRWIKIIILFVLVIIILIGGWNMYKKLEYNKQSYSADLYSYLSPQSTEVININNENGIEELLICYPELSEITNLVKTGMSYPAVIYKLRGEKRTLILRTTIEQKEKIEKYIETTLPVSFPPNAKEYKNGKITIYSLPDNEFISYTFHKGIFAISKNYKMIEDIIDVDSGNTFFTDDKYEKEISDILINSPIGVFIHRQENMMAFDLKMKDDTIRMDGYVFPYMRKDSVRIHYEIMQYLISLPENICIDYTQIQQEANPPTVKIILNKMY